jgi:hypothetical protein
MVIVPPVLAVALATVASINDGRPYDKDNAYLWYIDRWDHLPTLTLLHTAPLVRFVLAAGGIGVFGLRGTPPRASAWRFIRLFKALALSSIAVVAALVAQDFELRFRFQRMETEAHRLAESVTPRAIDPDENAAVHYQHAIDSMEEVWRSIEIAEDEAEGTVQAGSATADALFSEHKAVLESLRRGSQLPRCRFDDPYVPFDVIDVWDPRMALHGAAYLLGLYCQHNAIRGDTETALDDLGVLRRMQLHAMADPRNATVLALFKYEQEIKYTLEHILGNTSSPDREVLTSLLGQPYDLPLLRDQFITWSEAENKQLIAAFYSGTLPDELLNGLGPTGTSAVGRCWLRFFSGPDDLAAITAQYRTFHRGRHLDPSWQDEWRPIGNVAPIAGDDFVFRGAKLAHHRALNDLQIAATVFKLDHGRYPEDKNLLVPKYLDSLPEYPLIYWRSYNDGLIIYTSADDWRHEKPDLHEEVEYLRCTVFLGDAYDEYRGQDASKKQIELR